MHKVLDAPRPGGWHVAVGPPPLCTQGCCPQHLHWNEAGGPHALRPLQERAMTAGVVVSPVRWCHTAPPTVEAGAWLVLRPQHPGTSSTGRKEGQLERERLGGTPSPSPFHPRSQDPPPGKGCVAGGGDRQGTAGALGHDPLRWDIQSHRSPRAVPSGVAGGVKRPRSSLLGHSLHSFTRRPDLRAGMSGASGAAVRAWPCLSRNPTDPAATPRKPDPG